MSDSSSLAIVTGAAGGIGLAVAQRLLADRPSTQVLVVDYDEARLKAAWAQSLDARARVTAVGCDISTDTGLASLNGAIDKLGLPVTALANCAGVLQKRSVLETTAQDWQRVIDTNLRGTFFVSQAVGRRMVKQGRGAIVNIASVVAVTGQSNCGLYSMSKAGLVSLTQVLANEWGPHGVRCNSVSPGLIRTPMTEAAYQSPTLADERIALLSVKRIGAPDDIAGVVAFLLGDDAGYVNGQNIVVDGGLITNLLSTVPGGQALRQE